MLIKYSKLSYDRIKNIIAFGKISAEQRNIIFKLNGNTINGCLFIFLENIFEK